MTSSVVWLRTSELQNIKFIKAKHKSIIFDPCLSGEHSKVDLRMILSRSGFGGFFQRARTGCQGVRPIVSVWEAKTFWWVGWPVLGFSRALRSLAKRRAGIDGGRRGECEVTWIPRGCWSCWVVGTRAICFFDFSPIPKNHIEGEEEPLRGTTLGGNPRTHPLRRTQHQTIKGLGGWTGTHARSRCEPSEWEWRTCGPSSSFSTKSTTADAPRPP